VINAKGGDRFRRQEAGAAGHVTSVCAPHLLNGQHRRAKDLEPDWVMSYARSAAAGHSARLDNAKWAGRARRFELGRWARII
jgi:hypothetical protein